MNDWVGLTIGEVLRICGTRFDEITPVDEPPGKLRAVEFPWRSQGEEKRVVLQVEYDDALFSAERRWERALVEKQRVVAVHDSTDFLP